MVKSEVASELSFSICSISSLPSGITSVKNLCTSNAAAFPSASLCTSTFPVRKNPSLLLSTLAIIEVTSPFLFFLELG